MPNRSALWDDMARRARQSEMSGWLDFWKKKPEQKSLYEVARESQLPALPPPQGTKKSLYEAAKERRLPAPAKPTKKSLVEAARERQYPAPPAPPKAHSLVEAAKSKLPAAPKKEAEKKVDWKAILSPEQKQTKELRPLHEVVRSQMPVVETPSRYVFISPSAPPEITPRRSYEMITAPQEVSQWDLPTATQLAEHFSKKNDLEAIWNFIRQTRADPAFKEDQLALYDEGVPVTVPIDPVVWREMYTDFANFYGIPWAVMEMYLKDIDRLPRDQQKAAEDALWADIISPLNAIVPDAFELLKPDDIPGYFNVSFDDPKRTIGRLERDRVSLIQERARLDLSDPEFREKLSYLQSEIERLGEVIERMYESGTTGRYYLFYTEPLLSAGGQGAA